MGEGQISQHDVLHLQDIGTLFFSCEISVSGYGDFGPGPNVAIDLEVAPNEMHSRLALPTDLSESVEEVCLVHEDANLSGFQSNVINLVENEQKVHIFHLIMHS